MVTTRARCSPGPAGGTRRPRALLRFVLGAIPRPRRRAPGARARAIRWGGAWTGGVCGARHWNGIPNPDFWWGGSRSLMEGSTGSRGGLCERGRAPVAPEGPHGASDLARACAPQLGQRIATTKVDGAKRLGTTMISWAGGDSHGLRSARSARHPARGLRSRELADAAATSSVRHELWRWGGMGSGTEGRAPLARAWGPARRARRGNRHARR